MPQYEMGHLKIIQEIKAELKNFPTLKIAGNAYEGPGIPDCVRSGETAAEDVQAVLAKWDVSGTLSV
jgi:oxygen-dependent protoporphyrinogen oxidase